MADAHFRVPEAARPPARLIPVRRDVLWPSGPADQDQGQYSNHSLSAAFFSGV
jgi:hypothetical protein